MNILITLNSNYMIFIPFNSFSEITETDKQTEALLRIHDHLEDGGIFVCTLYHPAYRRKTADGMLRFVGSFKLPENRSLTVSYYNFSPFTEDSRFMIFLLVKK